MERELSAQPIFIYSMNLKNEAKSVKNINTVTDETQYKKHLWNRRKMWFLSQSDAVVPGVSDRILKQMHTVNRTPKYATTTPVKQPSWCQDCLSLPMILITRLTSVATLPWGEVGVQTVYRVCQKQWCLRLQVACCICQDLLQGSPVLWKGIYPNAPQTLVWLIYLFGIRSFCWQISSPMSLFFLMKIIKVKNWLSAH